MGYFFPVPLSYFPSNSHQPGELPDPPTSINPHFFLHQTAGRDAPSLLRRNICYSEQNIMLLCYLIKSKFIGSICAEDKMFGDSLVLFLSK